MDREEIRKKFISSTKEQMQQSYQKEEYVLMQAINAYNESNKSYNLANERLSEWFGLYVPELKTSNFIALANIACMLAQNKIDKEGIISAIGNAELGENIYNMIKNSIGRELNEFEAKALEGFAQYAIASLKNMDVLSEYIKNTSTKLLPNLTYLTDDKIAAELLSKAGSIERLATMPSSTVQLLGAEKALFKHIKYGTKPPKYGILFKLADVTAAPKNKKGRIARVYATKITIALKADYLSKRFIADKLKEDLTAAIKKIMDAPDVIKLVDSDNRTEFDMNRTGGNWKKGNNNFRGNNRNFGKQRRNNPNKINRDHKPNNDW